MNSQKEYDDFITKVLKAGRDIRNDFDNLSEDNKLRFTQQANTVLKAYGYGITIEELMQRLTL